MKKKILLKKVIKITLASLILLMVSPIMPAHAAALTGVKDTMTRLKAATLSDHTIAFTTVTTIPASGTIVVDFPTGFAMEAALDYTDIDLKLATVDIVLAATPGTGAGTAWGAVRTDADTITLTNNDTDTFTAGAVEIQVGLNATFGVAGNKQTTNPGASNNLVMTITTSAGDSGSLAVSIISNDQVTVSATVNPTFTFTISSTTCALGTLSTANVQTCSVTLTTSTNAVSGYTTTVVGTATGAELVHTNATDNINNATGVEVNAGVEEFGIGTSDTGVDIVTESDCAGADGSPAADAESIDKNGDNVAASVALAAGPVSSDATTACFAASIAATTIAGSYTSTVTFISTGTF
ncbi:hypothetical protein HZB93_01315 [Candidatus Falkowbacteria bacterium]|nr:hypothetical protein [Candidatus Falkowbacteria bacterium]